MKDRSITGFVQIAISVKSWMKSPPPVEVVRPGRCPRCGAASRPEGGGLQMHGHGLRERQLRGVLEPGGQPVIVVLLLRRFLCLVCGCVATVVPRGVVRGRLYSAGAIALALALFGIGELSEAAVRERSSPWKIVGPTAAKGWCTLRRWVRAIRSGRLWPGVAALREGWTVRAVARRVASVLAASGPVELRSADPAAAVFVAAARGL